MTTEAEVGELAHRIADLADSLSATLSEARRLAADRSAIAARFGTIDSKNITESLVPAFADLAENCATGWLAVLEESRTVVADLEFELAEAQEAAADLIEEGREALLDDAKEIVADLIEEPAGMLYGKCDEIRNELHDAISRMIDDIVSSARDSIQSKTENLAAQLRETVDDFADSLETAGTRGNAEEQSMRVALDQLRPAVQAIMDQFDRVKNLAAIVGL